MTTYRPGNHWDRTIVREGTGPVDTSGRRPDDQLAIVVTLDDPEQARELRDRVAYLLNLDLHQQWRDRQFSRLIAEQGSPDEAPANREHDGERTEQ